MADFTLTGTATLNATGFTKGTKAMAAGLNKTNAAAGKSKKTLGGLSDSFKGMSVSGLAAGTAVIAAGKALVSYAIDATKAAVAAEEIDSKFVTVTGDAAELADGVLDMANVFGATRTEMKGVIGTTSAIAQGFGFAQDASVQFSVDTVKLAGDLASFNDIQGGAAEVSEILTSAYSGEREQLKKLGIVITQADVDQKALADSGKTATKELTTQDKALATLALVTERAGVAVGDLGRTQDSTANAAKASTAAWREQKENLGKQLIPVFNELLSVSGEMLGPIGELAGPVFGSLAEIVRALVKAFKPLVLALLPVFTLGFKILNPLLRKTGDVLGFIANVLATQINAALSIYVEIARKAVEAWAAIQRAFGNDEGADAADRLADSLGDTAQGYRDSARDAAAAAVESARSAVGMETNADAADRLATSAKVMGSRWEAMARASVGATGDTEDLTDALEEQEDQAEDTRNAIQKVADTLRASTDPAFAAAEALRDVREAQADYTDVVDEHGATSEEAAEAAIELFEAQLDLNNALGDAQGKTVEAVAGLDAMLAAGQITAEQHRILASQIRDVGQAVDDIDGKSADLILNVQESLLRAARSDTRLGEEGFIPEGSGTTFSAGSRTGSDVENKDFSTTFNTTVTGGTGSTADEVAAAVNRTIGALST